MPSIALEEIFPACIIFCIPVDTPLTYPLIILKKPRLILPSILEYEASQLSKLSKDNSQITSQYTIKEPRNLNKECELKFETIIYHLRLFHGYCFYLILAKLCLKVRNSKVQSRRRHKNLITETEH